MSNLALAWAEAQDGLEPGPRAVLLALAAQADVITDRCAPDPAELARAAACDPEAIPSHVVSLVQAQLVLVTEHGIKLNLDLDMLVRHLRRNRLAVGPAPEPVALPEASPKPEPKLAAAKAAKPAQEPAPEPAPAYVWVEEGTPEWRAWEAHEAREGRRLTALRSTHQARPGRTMRSLWPPGHAPAAAE